MEEGSTSNANNAMQRLTTVYNQVTEVGADVAQVLLEPVSMHFFSRNHRNGDLSKTFLLLFAHHGFQTLVAPHQSSRPAIAVYAASSRRGNVDDQFAKRDTALVERAASPAPATVQAPGLGPGSLNVGQLATAESLGKFGAPSANIDADTNTVTSPEAIDVFKGAAVLVEDPNGGSSKSPTGKGKSKGEGNSKGDSKGKAKAKDKGNHHTTNSDKSNKKTKTGKSAGGTKKDKKEQSDKHGKTHGSPSSNDTPPSSPR